MHAPVAAGQRLQTKYFIFVTAARITIRDYRTAFLLLVFFHKSRSEGWK
jgi:hypothetical protein